MITEAFTRVVGEPPIWGADTTPADVESWGSLTHVQLVFEIEQALGIRLPEHVLTGRTTFGALVEAAETAVKAAEAA
ncbi:MULTISPECIES: acyl carrier protein [unclassified Micromonospora]|uniref:acyl carrier protein n=1 Tax=unclassified Micromonospora TaxID=2617518 RepID=UPI003645B204